MTSNLSCSVFLMNNTKLSGILLFIYCRLLYDCVNMFLMSMVCNRVVCAFVCVCVLPRTQCAFTYRHRSTNSTKYTHSYTHTNNNVCILGVERSYFLLPKSAIFYSIQLNLDKRISQSISQNFQIYFV